MPININIELDKKAYFKAGITLLLHSWKFWAVNMVTSMFVLLLFFWNNAAHPVLYTILFLLARILTRLSMYLMKTERLFKTDKYFDKVTWEVYPDFIDSYRDAAKSRYALKEFDKILEIGPYFYFVYNKQTKYMIVPVKSIPEAELDSFRNILREVGGNTK
jgi:hypothetical protein